MTSDTRPLAVVTGAAAGIGYEMAKCCADNGFDLLVAADHRFIHEAAQECRALGSAGEAFRPDVMLLDLGLPAPDEAPAAGQDRRY